jgi:hypothetical protein
MKRWCDLEIKRRQWEVIGQSTRLQFVSVYFYNCVAGWMACPEGAGWPLYRERHLHPPIIWNLAKYVLYYAWLLAML